MLDADGIGPFYGGLQVVTDDCGDEVTPGLYAVARQEDVPSNVDHVIVVSGWWNRSMSRVVVMEGFPRRVPIECVVCHGL